MFGIMIISTIIPRNLYTYEELVLLLLLLLLLLSSIIYYYVIIIIIYKIISIKKIYTYNI